LLCRLVVVALVQQVIIVNIIVVIAVVVVVIVVVVVVIVNPRGAVIGTVVDYLGSVRGLFGYVPYGYDAVVVVNLVIVEFVCVGVYNRRCRHSCNVERLEVDIASHSFFGSPMGTSSSSIDGRG
jgi:hypothetical protein